jgi:hypothetical protein
MNNIDIILNAHQESTAYSLNESLFETCYNISNVIIRTTNSTSYKALGFNSCYQINNINLSVGISKLLLNTKVTNNIQLSNWDGGSYTPYETYVPTFDSCETISNINSTFTTGRSIGAFNNCSYVVNCKINNITSDDIINITKDSNNSWNNVVLKIDDTLSHYDIETNMTTVEIKSSSFSNGKTAKLTYASGCIGKYYTIKDVDGNLSDNNFFLLQTFDNIDGMPFVKLKNPYASIILYSDGLAWKIIDDSNIKNSQIITTATYFLQFTDVISLIDTSTNTPTVILPNPTLKHVIGKSYMIKDKSGNAFTKNITISPYSSEKIDGLNSVIINVNYGSVVVVSDGTNWYRMINNTLFGY